MKIYQNENGVTMVEIDGEIQEAKIVTDKKGQWIILPKNQYNRQCISMAKLIKNGGEIIIDTIKIPNETKDHEPRKISRWENYLTEDEKSIINEIKEKAFQRAEKQRLIDEIEDLNKRLEKYL